MPFDRDITRTCHVPCHNKKKGMIFLSITTSRENNPVFSLAYRMITSSGVAGNFLIALLLLSSCVPSSELWASLLTSNL